MLRTVDVAGQVASNLSDVVADFAGDQVKSVHHIAVVTLVLFASLFDEGCQDQADGSDDGNDDAFHGYAPSAFLMAASMPAWSWARRLPISM